MDTLARDGDSRTLGEGKAGRPTGRTGAGEGGVFFTATMITA